jgi:regulatory protein YycI of two-component signal transduction system YycFG
MKITGWIAAFILFLIILGMQLCANKKLSEGVTKADYNAMVKAKNDTIKYHKDIIKADSAAINKAHMATAEQVEKSELYRRSLAESQNQVQRLADKVAAAKKEKPDASWVAVSPNYVTGCDSLRLVAIDQNTKIDQVQQENKKTVELMDYEISLRDTALQHRDAFNRALLNQLDSCHAKVKVAVNQNRTELYGGVGLLGNKTSPIGGGEGGLLLKTKKDKLYEAKYIITNRDWWVGGKVYFKIF